MRMALPAPPSWLRLAPGHYPPPQATLISELAKGVLEGRIEWGLISVGALIGVVLIVIDEALGKAGLTRLPPLASGMGIYLPVIATAPIVLGAISGWLYQRWIANRPYAPIVRRLVVLLASGLIVGESLFGVLLAGLIVVTNPEISSWEQKSSEVFWLTC